MGGPGSGRHWYFGAANCTDDYRTLDVRRLQRDGLMTADRAFGWKWTRDGETVASIQVRTEADRVILSYRHRSGGGEWKTEEYPMRLNWTPCTYGGRRAWFICPAAGCVGRVAILYLGGDIFACRHCYQLAYPSQRETDGDRAIRRADKIRERLGWEPGILNGNGWKPKGMHWRTFERLTAEHDAFVGASLAAMARCLHINIQG
ncbi:MAG: hypothetical protein ACREVK_10705 [Gammaproteobacteria bacterium]